MVGDAHPIKIALLQLVQDVILSTGIFVGLAAIAAMQGNFLAEEALVAQVKAGNYWAWYGSESIKYDTQQSSQVILQSLGKPLPASLTQKADPLDKEKLKAHIPQM